MLRVTEDARPVGRMVRWGLAGLLVLAALGASAMRGPAQGPAAGVPVGELPPFDLTYVPSSTNCIYALRPAAVLARSEMKEVVERLNRQFAEVLSAADIPNSIRIPLEEIEQVVLAGEGKRSAPPPGRDWQPGEPKNAMLLQSVLIRMTHDFDWLAWPRALAAVAKGEVREVRPHLYRLESKLNPIHFLIPDRRTICVLGLDLPPGYDRFDELLEKMKLTPETRALLGPAWSKVERSAMAVAIDNRTGYWTHDGVSSPEGDKAIELIGHPTHVVAGLDVGDIITGRVFVTGADDAAADKALQGIKALAALGQVVLKVAPAEDDTGRFLLKVYGELLKDYSVRRDGTMVTAEFRSPTRLVDLSKLRDFGEPVKK